MKCFTYCHVWSASNLHGLGNGVHEASRDAKVTQLELTILTHENVGRLDIWGGGGGGGDG